MLPPAVPNHGLAPGTGLFDFVVALGWGSSPVVVSADARNEAWPSIAPDGSGGALITWHAYYIYPGTDESLSSLFYDASAAYTRGTA